MASPALCDVEALRSLLAAACKAAPEALPGREANVICLYGPTGHFLKSFGGFRELCGYFNRSESLKHGEGTSGASRDPAWSFTLYSHARLSVLRQHSCLTDAEREAHEQGLDCVEICSGDSSSPERLAVTPDLDLPCLMRTWCYGYAAFRGYALFEILYSGQGEIANKLLAPGFPSRPSCPFLPAVPSQPGLVPSNTFTSNNGEGGG